MKNFQHISEKGFIRFWKGKFDDEKLKEDLYNLEIFYKNNGYRDIQILSKDINFLARTEKNLICLFISKRLFWFDHTCRI